MAADVAALTRSFFSFFSPLLLFFLNDLSHFSVHVFIFSDLRTISFFFLPCVNPPLELGTLFPSILIGHFVDVGPRPPA